MSHGTGGDDGVGDGNGGGDGDGEGASGEGGGSSGGGGFLGGGRGWGTRGGGDGCNGGSSGGRNVVTIVAFVPDDGALDPDKERKNSRPSIAATTHPAKRKQKPSRLTSRPDTLAMSDATSDSSGED